MMYNQLWRKVLLIAVPFTLAFVELFHPYGFSKNVYGLLSKQWDAWITVHFLQLPLFALIGLAMYIAGNPLKGFMGLFNRVSIFGFVLFYVTFDAIAGLGTGFLIKIGHHFSQDEQRVIAQVVQDYFLHPIVGGMNSVMSLTASFFYLFAASSLGLGLFLRKKITSFVLLLFGLSAITVWYSHAYPYGPIGFLLLGCAMIGLEFFPPKTR